MSEPGSFDAGLYDVDFKADRGEHKFADLESGTRVVVVDDHGKRHVAKTRSRPWKLTSGVWVVLLTRPFPVGGYRLDRVEQVHPIQDQEADLFEGNECDGSELSWTCPKCKAKNNVGDIVEVLNGKDFFDELDVECHACKSTYLVTVRGEYQFHTTEMYVTPSEAAELPKIVKKTDRVEPV